MEQPQILLIVTPEGLERTEVLSPNEAQQELAFQTYSKFAFEIHRFGRRLEQLLQSEASAAKDRTIKIHDDDC
jgi:hypothetical protein